MEAKLRVLNDIRSQIEKARINFKKSPKDRKTAAYIDARLETLEDLIQSFKTEHKQLIETCDTQLLEKQEYVTNDVFEFVSDTYLDYKVELKSALPNKCIELASSAATSAPVKSNVKLPKIQIPTFSGDYAEWTSFRDLFLSMIHNNRSIDDVQKLHYLKTQLAGEALQLVKHVPVTQNNYLKCWELLNDRFNNIKFMANSILKRLMNQPKMVTECSKSLKELLDNTTGCLHELRNLGIDVSTWDILVIYILGEKLNAESRKQWELQTNHSVANLPTFVEFAEFLESRFRALEVIEPSFIKPKDEYDTTPTHKVMHVTSNSKGVCPICSEDHVITDCTKFTGDGVENRMKMVLERKLCFNCLGVGHINLYCRNKKRCESCSRKHHILLHDQGKTTGAVVGATVETVTHMPTIPSETIQIHHTTGNKEQVLLATALIRAEAGESSQVLRALLDQGSQASFITEAAVQSLRLKKIITQGTISGVGGGESRINTKYMVWVDVQSLHNPSYKIKVKAYVLGILTSVLPSRSFEMKNDWPEIKQITLADPTFNQSNKIDILLGAAVYGQIMKEGFMKSPYGSTIAQNTVFGWIISGQTICQNNLVCSHNTIVSLHAQEEDNEILKKFWELESESSTSETKMMTPEERACEEYFAATTQRDETGRYVVRLPFRDEDPECKYGRSKGIAVKRLHSLERKFSKNDDVKQKYIDVIKEYLQLGHMEYISGKVDREKPDAVYLPHHAVIKEERTTTKTRVVFDASCKGSNGVSLNETLMVGPTLQPDLRHIVIRWRQHPICLGADIVKMYRQIRVSEKDADFQRIVWRDNDNKEVEDFRLLTVTFGTSCAPYLAVKALQQVAHDDGHRYPLAAERVLNNFYMDDLMTGCQSEAEAIVLYQQCNKLLEGAGFQLQKWTSNKSELLANLKEDKGGDLEVKTDQVTKILGLTWNKNTDEFTYTVKLDPLPIPVTKRKIIAEIARLYDPLGWIAPCIITAKVFIQKLWVAGLDWDADLPLELLEEWIDYRNELSQLIDFRIPRWLNQRGDDTLAELHGYCDASNIAYAAVVYIRVVDSSGDVHSHLVTAKTRVAPVKQISIPRLELCGAVLVVQLLLEVSKLLKIPSCNLHAWTDSTVVLAWLSAHPSKWKTFVANRTSQILTQLEVSQWSHVKSKDNPADCVSRGISSTALLENQLWKEGPLWLREKDLPYRRDAATTHEEERSVKVHTAIATNDDTAHCLLTNYSSLRRLVRVIAYCRRFLQMKKSPGERVQTSYLSALELRESSQTCIRLCQREGLEEEYNSLIKDKAVNKKSVLSSLNPFVDENGIIRVGGRIQNSDLNEDSKHPIIIPYDSHLAKLLVTDAHEKTLHGGIQLTLNVLRAKYWIVRGKCSVKSHIRNCVRCIRYSGVTRTQLMGQLTSCRVMPSKPFLHTGVDYAGPIDMRVSKGRGHKSYKGYICLFVCMSTRAVHIEAVSDLTSQGFLAAFKRFVARRGHCQQLWSDNGTNFVGASKELKTLFAGEFASLTKEVACSLANNGTEWHFIPPHAPNFGGLWEAGIKSTKHHLKRVIGDSMLTYEEMATVLSQIEACLNSRPLSSSSSDPNDLQPLTPGHFLIGEQLVLTPDKNFEICQLNSLRRWQLTQRMVQCFWRRWSREYLTQFFQRHKWSTVIKEPKVGDVVLVKEENLPPAKWLYGKIAQLHPGKDGHVRVATLTCKGSTLKRPTSKLCVLPTD